MMGLGRWLLLGDLGQQMDLADQKAEIERIKNELRSQSELPSTDRRLEELERENDTLRLYLSAVIRLLQFKKIVTDDEVRTWVRTIDGEDGRFDNRQRGDKIG